ncbi:MAG: hypothetical protein P1P82_16635 [Bacteroidales bacterium]|nr:hypothetical protein [Bacteroidales bacterium]MDT8430711.1 hypothetical protein [Bacteroidales bacterium]
MKSYIALWLIVMTFIAACSPVGKSEFNDYAIIVSGQYEFTPEFTVLYSETDPKLALRPTDVEGVRYNMTTWMVAPDKVADLEKVEVDESQAGDGFDDRIAEGRADGRTHNVFRSGLVIEVEATGFTRSGDTVYFVYENNELFTLDAYAVLRDDGPNLHFSLTPKIHGYYSVGYTGAPVFNIEEVAEIWQPMLWQEKRFPEKPYTTLAFRAPVPTTLVYDGSSTLGVLADPKEFSFNPLPTLSNSRFGILIRNNNGDAQPQLYAPVMGGTGSRMKPGDRFEFSMFLLAENSDITHTYEKIARERFGFRDYRKNDIASLNETFDNIVDYAMSDYAWFVDSLKGCAYSTDVPGAVKNVSSLNPLELAIVTDDASIFEARAYPVMEYMLSRQKFLFSLDSTQKIQHPSRKLLGPIAPVSELGALYSIFGRNNDFLTQLAKDEYNASRIRNLDVEEQGKTWINAMHLYRATGDEEYLERAIKGADEYLQKRVGQRQTEFVDPWAAGMFFWTGFVNRWIELTELYEITKDERYLQAAHDGARHYTMFTWMSPAIPDSMILVNEGGKAPLYWYLKSKGHQQMHMPEELAPAWRLSEIGLTPESSITCSGHRAIFMANYAPWMLRLGYYTGDNYLQEVAKAAIIGRYRNFPGYHINTARTTAYEKEDYPLHPHKELSVNSFHYNHIMPMASMLLDYLVTDVFVRSDGAISFPSAYIEGYAYLQNKFYGHQPGSFYEDQEVMLWMPRDLLTIGNVELNYITARKDDVFYIAFTNQSQEDIETNFTINQELVHFSGDEQVFVRKGDKWKSIRESGGEINIVVTGNGLTVLRIKGVEVQHGFQEEILAETGAIPGDYKELDFGNARAMIFNMGEYSKRAYIYLRDDDTKFRNVTLHYTGAAGEEITSEKLHYPFEFTVDLSNLSKGLEFYLTGTTLHGKEVRSESVKLGE